MTVARPAPTPPEAGYVATAELLGSHGEVLGTATKEFYWQVGRNCTYDLTFLVARQGVAESVRVNTGGGSMRPARLSRVTAVEVGKEYIMHLVLDD